jgi:hypothetical protein
VARTVVAADSWTANSLAVESIAILQRRACTRTFVTPDAGNWKFDKVYYQLDLPLCVYEFECTSRGCKGDIARDAICSVQGCQLLSKCAML